MRDKEPLNTVLSALKAMRTTYLPYDGTYNPIIRQNQ